MHQKIENHSVDQQNAQIFKGTLPGIKSSNRNIGDVTLTCILSKKDELEMLTR